eukprot:Nk52_evm56s621 gene=Nk52_evmTU56s621
MLDTEQLFLRIHYMLVESCRNILGDRGRKLMLWLIFIQALAALLLLAHLHIEFSGKSACLDKHLEGVYRDFATRTATREAAEGRKTLREEGGGGVGGDNNQEGGGYINIKGMVTDQQRQNGDEGKHNHNSKSDLSGITSQYWEGKAPPPTQKDEDNTDLIIAKSLFLSDMDPWHNLIRVNIVDPPGSVEGEALEVKEDSHCTSSSSSGSEYSCTKGNNQQPQQKTTVTVLSDGRVVFSNNREKQGVEDSYFGLLSTDSLFAFMLYPFFQHHFYDPVYDFALKESCYLGLSDHARAKHNVNVVSINIPTNDSCLGTSLTRGMLNLLLGYDSVVLLNFFNHFKGRGFLYSLHHGSTYGMEECSMWHPSFDDSFLPDEDVPLWRFLMFKCQILFSSITLFVMFAVPLSIIVREAQIRLIQFSVVLASSAQPGNRSRNEYIGLLLHFTRCCTHLVVMVGITVLVAEFFFDDILALFMVMTIWLSEFFTLTCVRCRLTQVFWPKFYSLLTISFFLYYLRNPFSFTYLAWSTHFCWAHFISYYFFDRVELPAVEHNLITFSNPRYGLRRATIPAAYVEPVVRAVHRRTPLQQRTRLVFTRDPSRLNESEPLSQPTQPPTQDTVGDVPVSENSADRPSDSSATHPSAPVTTVNNANDTPTNAGTLNGHLRTNVSANEPPIPSWDVTSSSGNIEEVNANTNGSESSISNEMTTQEQEITNIGPGPEMNEPATTPNVEESTVGANDTSEQALPPGTAPPQTQAPEYEEYTPDISFVASIDGHQVQIAEQPPGAAQGGGPLVYPLGDEDSNIGNNNNSEASPSNSTGGNSRSGSAPTSLPVRGAGQCKHVIVPVAQRSHMHVHFVFERNNEQS